ncbi:cysteine hydrolase [Vibrio mimicus]
MKKTALLVIDVQHGLFTPEPRPYAADEVVNNINLLTHWARQHSLPVVFIQHQEAGLEAESAGWQLEHQLNVAASDHFIRKTTPDSFLRTELAALLEENAIEHLIVTGYASDFCVDTTIRSAAGKGYSIQIVSDAHTTHDTPYASGELIRNHHTYALSHTSSFGVSITAITTQSLLAEQPNS